MVLNIVGVILTISEVFVQIGYAQVPDMYDKVIFPPLPVAVTDSDNPVCNEDSESYVRGLQNFTLWAYEMWDATAKSPTGILRGSVFQMGHFDQCLTVDAPFDTQYCLTTLAADVPDIHQPIDPISLYHKPEEMVLQRLYQSMDVSQQSRNTIQVAWCIPASCSPKDLQNSLNNHIDEIDLPMKDFNVSYTASVSELMCHLQKDRGIRLNGADVAFCLVAAILALLVLIFTCYDYNQRSGQNGDGTEVKPKQKSFLCRIFLSFSARENCGDLTKADESNGALTILYGMRTICILFIILDHRFGTFTSSALLNFDYVEMQYRATFAPFLFHGDLFVDSFFLLSGLLGTYGLLNTFDKNKMGPGFIILMRYIRLTPVYAFVIFYYATLFNYTGSGPLWKLIVGQDSQDCKDNWWTNLLYISNYVNADHMCMTHSWYLPCDFHYFIIGIFVCLTIKRSKKLGLCILTLLIFASIIIPFALTVVYLRPALLHFYPDFLTGPKTHPDFLLTYSKSHTRATPYFVGMLAGYIYYRLQGKDTHVCRIKSYSVLLVSIVVILISIIGGSVFYDPYHAYNPWESAAYAALHRPAFAIGSVGVLFIASFGHASFIYKALTWSPWIPLSKLVYGAYLVHMNFQLRSAAKFMNPRQISYFDVICLALSDMVLAFVCAFGLYLAIEAPFRKIFRLLMTGPPKATAPATPENTTEIMMGQNAVVEDDKEAYRRNNNNGNYDSRL